MATGTVSSIGIGSGLDVNSIVASTISVEKLPLTALQDTATTIQTKLSAFGQIQSFVSSFRDASAQLQTATNFAVTSATSSDAGSVAATSTTDAVPGTYTVAVSSLASTQSTVSAGGRFSASTDPVGTGSITISLGSWSAGQTAFTAKPGATAVVIPIGAGDNTLAGIRDKINAANAGVSATLVTDANGTRLALQSSSTGATNGFRVTTADDDGNNTDTAGLSRLAYDPASGTTDTTQTQAATNTKATINGIAVETTGSTLTNVVGGITFNLGKVTTAPVTVNITRNTDSVKSLVTNFVASYNALSSFLSSATAYDATNKKAALLQGDATTTGLQNQLRAAIGQPTKASTTFSTLSDLGIQMQKDGRLKVDDTKLNAALANLPELSKALTKTDLTTPGNNGIAKKLTSWADGLLAATGSIAGKTKSIQSQLASNQSDQDKLSARISDDETRLRAKYTALDTTLSNANSLQKYVTQQIATWNKASA